MEIREQSMEKERGDNHNKGRNSTNERYSESERDCLIDSVSYA